MKTPSQTQKMPINLRGLHVSRVISGWFQGRRVRRSVTQQLSDQQLAAFYMQPFGRVNATRTMGKPAEQRTPRRASQPVQQTAA